jgi:hypothetical protein
MGPTATFNFGGVERTVKTNPSTNALFNRVSMLVFHGSVYAGPTVPDHLKDLLKCAQFPIPQNFSEACEKHFNNRN